MNDDPIEYTDQLEREEHALSMEEDLQMREAAFESLVKYNENTPRIGDNPDRHSRPAQCLAFHDAILNQHANKVQAMLQNDPSLTLEGGFDAVTPIAMAASVRNLDICKTILACHPETVLIEDALGTTALEVAIGWNDPDLVRAMIEPNLERIRGTTLNHNNTYSHLAAHAGNHKALEVLIKAFPETVRMENAKGQIVTEMAHFARDEQGKFNCLRILAENHPGSFSHKNPQTGKTPMDLVKESRSHAIAQIIIDRSIEKIQEHDQERTR